MSLQSELRKAAARVLRLRPESIELGAPLTRYGLDSLNALELAAAVSEIADREFSDELLVDYSSIAAIADYLAGVESRVHPLELMLADSVLPDDVAPSRNEAGGSAVLVTGATGFLGRHLVEAVLRHTQGEVLCLVRAADDASAQRRLGNRVRAVAGDLDQPRLGLTPEKYAGLQHRVGSIFHCAAAVDWSLGYESLRVPNVLGTLELLRFASGGGRKAFHFVSSTSACYSTRNTSTVRESDPPVDPAGIHLGYAQSKWVSEALVRAAAARGLPAIIYRPSLIAGHSRSGAGNNEDFLASLIKGCIELGMAPDLAWRMDACPVDFVAGAIARLSGADAPVVHLLNPRRAGWLEAVLWMNLRGYRVRPVPFSRWIEEVAQRSREPSHPLHRLRGFLLNQPAGSAGRYLPELYAEERLGMVDDKATRLGLAAAGVECPRLGPHLLERWFDGFQRSGFLPAPRAPRPSAPRPAGMPNLASELERMVGEPIAHAERFEFGGEASILGELASWRAGTTLALHGYRLQTAARRFSVVLKPKLDDRTVLEVASEVAALCDPRLGAAFRAHCHRTSLAGTADREIKLYQRGNPALRKHAARCHGVLQLGSQRALVLEHIADLQLNDGCAIWQRQHVEAALDGISEVHASPVGADIQPWLRPLLDVRATAASMDLWIALSDYAQPWIAAFAGRAFAAGLSEMAKRSVVRRLALERMPQALIHHDFNPRNIGLRSDGRLCALDWELATIGVPQRDLAELLCFVLPPNAHRDMAMHFVEHHRRRFCQISGRKIDREQWLEGLRLSLEDFAVQRLTMYLIAHRFRAQPFLERAARTWAHLTTLFARSSAREVSHAVA